MTSIAPREPRSLDVMRGGRVALVDDDPTILTSLSRSLRRAGHEVVTSESPVDVLRRVVDEEFDVLISDIRMPEMDGLDLLTSVRKSRPNMPVILVSGSATMDAAMKALKSSPVNRPSGAEGGPPMPVMSARLHRVGPTGNCRYTTLSMNAEAAVPG